MVERAPNYPNMFSELPHMPASGYRCAGMAWTCASAAVCCAWACMRRTLSG